MRTIRPKVFLSFAGNDRALAKRLADDLEMYGVEAFYDARDVALGGNMVLSINRAMAESHYYVLLWSSNCVDRPWVDEEWAAAYAREINEERSFLFIVRLDQTPLPPLLAVRRYLDGIHDWPSVARALTDTWLDDLDTGTPVFPSPDPEPQIERSILVVRVRNQALVMTSRSRCEPRARTALSARRCTAVPRIRYQAYRRGQSVRWSTPRSPTCCHGNDIVTSLWRTADPT